MSSAYPDGSIGIGSSFSGKGRPSTVVLNQIQSLLYSKNVSLPVPKSRKNMYAAPGIPHQNNQYDAKFADPRTTKGTSITVESPWCIARQLPNGPKPASTILMSWRVTQTTPHIPIVILIAMRR